jgi:C4-dicarboxylate-specific signal transduction histidine kinase
LIRQLLLLGHMAPTTLQPVDVNAVLRGLVSELVFLIGATIEVDFASEAERAIVRGDKGKLERVLMNLVLTLHDVMPDGGVLSIGVRIVSLPETARDGRMTPREHVVIDIVDVRQDMAIDARIRLVDPYMGTRDTVPSQGVWLVGRAMMYDTVHSFGGFIEVDSAGGGLAFHVYLPWISHDGRAET